MLALVDRILAPLTWLVAAFAVLVLLIGPELIGAKKTNAYTASPPPAGKAVFAKAGCGGCHTLAKAGATGNVGPNLDQLKPDAATVQSTVTTGAGGMPAFKSRLTAAEIKAVARYVAGP